MIQIYETNLKRAEEFAKIYGITLNSYQRFLVMEEDGDIGLGVLQLEGGKVNLKHILTDKPFLYFDLLARSLLNLVRDMDITIKVKSDPYFLRFGFKDKGEFMEIQSGNIDFSGTCKGEK